MFKVVKKEIEVAGKKISLETGKIARQADSSVIATYGGTTVMANVVAAKEPKPDLDFFYGKGVMELDISQFGGAYMGNIQILSTIVDRGASN